MSDSVILDLALRLWPQARDAGVVADPNELDTLLDAIGLAGAPGYDGGLRYTFACFPPEASAQFTLPTGEQPADDAAARFIAHVLVTRTLLAVGLGVDERVARAVAEAHALSWATVDTSTHQAPLALAASLWLIALDPDGNSDRPLPIDWSAPCFEQWGWWDPDDRLHSHYDVRERALDWAVYVSYDGTRHAGVSRWTMVEPLLRLERDSRARLALSQLAAADDVGDRAPAMAMLERNRVSGMLRAYFAGGGGELR